MLPSSDDIDPSATATEANMRAMNETPEGFRRRQYLVEDRAFLLDVSSTFLAQRLRDELEVNAVVAEKVLMRMIVEPTFVYNSKP